MNTLATLNLRYVRATSDSERDAILTRIDELMESGKCPVCGEPTEEGTCWSVYCPEGRDNIDAEIGDQQYHAAVDRFCEVNP